MINLHISSTNSGSKLQTWCAQNFSLCDVRIRWSPWLHNIISVLKMNENSCVKKNGVKLYNSTRCGNTALPSRMLYLEFFAMSQTYIDAYHIKIERTLWFWFALVINENEWFKRKHWSRRFQRSRNFHFERYVRDDRQCFYWRETRLNSRWCPSLCIHNLTSENKAEYESSDFHYLHFNQE